MSNTSIILFGKPDSFESYELDTTGVKRIFDSFIEPELKLSQNQKYVYHQFINEGFSYLQIYSFAQAYQSGREGIVIGVAFKSDTLIELCNENFDILKLIFENFKDKTTTGIEFKSNSIDKNVKEFYQEAITYIAKIKYKNISVSKSINQSLLLYLPNIENGIKNLINEINLLKDVYISSNKEVFTSNINIKYLYNLENKFYTLNNENKIVEFKNLIDTKKALKSNSPVTDSDEVKKLKNEILNYKNKYDSIENKLIKYKNVSTKKIKLLSISSVLFCLITFSFFFKTLFLDDNKGDTNDVNSKEQSANLENGNSNSTTQQENNFNINDVLLDNSKRNTLYTLLQNIKNFESSIDKKKYSIAIIRDSKELGISSNFSNKYIIVEGSTTSVEEKDNINVVQKNKKDVQKKIAISENVKDRKEPKNDIHIKDKKENDVKVKNDEDVKDIKEAEPKDKKEIEE